MSLPVSLITALLSLWAFVGFLVAATAALRMHRILSARRRGEQDAAARRDLLALLADETATELPAGVDSERVGRLATSMLTKLRGADRDRLVSILERSGSVERARARTRGRGAVGRARAAELLGAVADERAVPDLVRLLDDRSADVRIVAARALGKLGVQAVNPLLGALDGRRPVPAAIVTMALVHVGPEGGGALADALRTSGSERARAVAADLLGHFGVYGAADQLVWALGHDASSSIRGAAARSLGRLGLKSAALPLLQAFHAADDAELLRSCARALGEIGSRETLDVLPPLLGSGDQELARTAAAGLAACGRDGIELLEQAATTPESAPVAREQLARLALRESARAGRRRAAEAA